MRDYKELKQIVKNKNKDLDRLKSNKEIEKEALNLMYNILEEDNFEHQEDKHVELKRIHYNINRAKMLIISRLAELE